jgi:hypothetical protein
MTLRQKARVGIFCAGLEFFAGAFLGICVSLYAQNIEFDYDHPHKDQRIGYEFGPCIYMGWGMMGTCFADGTLWLLSDWRRLFLFFKEDI